MRELRETGWMTQSVRMVVASFLCEVLNVDWRHGERHFHAQLVDADASINAMMWQNAGRSGIDQWNFFSSPESGSQDPTGRYVRRWVPELAALPNKWLHRPWAAPAEALAEARVALGETYPVRVVEDVAAAREATREAVLAMRRAAPSYNDAGGYDLIDLPGGVTTRVFTRQDLRLNRDGTLKPPPPKRGDAAGGRGRGGGRPKRGRSGRGGRGR